MCNLLVVVLNLNNWYQSTVPFGEIYKSVVDNVIKDISLLVISMWSARHNGCHYASYIKWDARLSLSESLCH